MEFKHPGYEGFGHRAHNKHSAWKVFSDVFGVWIKGFFDTHTRTSLASCRFKGFRVSTLTSRPQIP